MWTTLTTQNSSLKQNLKDSAKNLTDFNSNHFSSIYD